MSKNVVLVTFTNDVSGSVEKIRRSLEERGAQVLRFHTDRFPMETGVTFRQEEGRDELIFRGEGRELALGPDDAIWYRRARWAEGLPMTMERQLRNGCIIESEALLRGAMAAAPCFVLDPPEQVRRCGHKTWQLRVAKQVGLATPRTLITNNPDEVRAFAASCPGGVVTKMMGAFHVFNDQGEEQVVFTTTLTEAHLEKLDGLRYAPMVFQEKIPKALELRITVIGNKIFTAAVDSQRVDGAETDWRQRGLTLLESWVNYDLPPDIERRLIAYMHHTRMQYSAIDIIVDPDGRHVFLEANPAGECYWLEFNSPHFPMTSTLVDVLLGEPGARRVFPPLG
ncbi:MAG: MvdD family ATP-grasp ribosomal peptide maturase [Polyangiaceae bacterium]|jgi:hypothetical protein|nr:MvdD family ATP-grasp ribosomal peptide maturase [Polyangiaceae bacterium]